MRRTGKVQLCTTTQTIDFIMYPWRLRNQCAPLHIDHSMKRQRSSRYVNADVYYQTPYLLPLAAYAQAVLHFGTEIAIIPLQPKS